MQFSDILNIFQGITTFFTESPHIAFGRIGLILLGGLLVYLGKKGTLEPLLMIPMGLGMVAVNAGVLLMPATMSNTIVTGSLDTPVIQYMTEIQNADAYYQAEIARISALPQRTETRAAELDYANKMMAAAKTRALIKYVTDKRGPNPTPDQIAKDREELEKILALHDEESQKSNDSAMPGTLFLAPLVQQPNQLMDIIQINFLQPIYTFAFGNGLIACLVFMGIGVLLDVGFLLARPFLSMFLALCAEFGTIVTFPIGVALGLTNGEAASIALVGGADGPMVLFGSLMLAKHLFVPITVVAYLYLGLAYGGYPYLIKFLVPAKLRAIKLPPRPIVKITVGEKLAFAVVGCAILCLLFPSAAPLFLSLFLGIAVREAGLKVFSTMIESVFLYGATMFLGLLLGVLCEASTILNPKVLLLLVLGILSLLLSGVGGLIGGYIAYLASGRKINPVIGIAAVSCVPTTAKVAQKEVSAANPNSIVLPEALGANISGVITTAIITGIYVALVPIMH
ncbi:MAG: sodium ion-translocating decarboxylase subunit beta [Opitutaceae bacterium]|jgi:oxaloacetate decarboxylase beta subunit|nr:sodium ion-translocating decarboxylase subunit beta [Opitutaceae bacterium]